MRKNERPMSATTNGRHDSSATTNQSASPSLQGAYQSQQRYVISKLTKKPKVAERPTPPGVIRCPICSQESHVGNDVRYVHSMLLDFVRVAELNENPNAVMDRRCRACKSEQHAVAVCAQCQSDLCSNCLTAHSVMKLFDGHVVTKDPNGRTEEEKTAMNGIIWKPATEQNPQQNLAIGEKLLMMDEFRDGRPMLIATNLRIVQEEAKF